MADHSKVAVAAGEGFADLLRKALIGTRNRKAISAVVLAIIGYLIYAKNKKSATDSLKLTEKRGDKKVQHH